MSWRLAWFRRRRAAKKAREAQLREFVYLDDVSVYSLLASRIGAIAEDFTDTDSSSLRGDISSSLGMSAAVAKGKVTSRTESTRTTSSQVVRRSSTQARFKQLLEYEKETLALRPPNPDESCPRLRAPEDLATAADRGKGWPWVIDAAAMRRGQLLEIEVELEAEAIFRVSTTLAALLEIIEDNPELLGEVDKQGISEGVAAGRILDRLLVGLVPIRGRAVHYRVVHHAARDWIVQKDALEQFSEHADVMVDDLFVVGVGEAGLFWKDIRRVLFSKSRYSMMCRVGVDGIRRDWTPVKLVKVLEDLLPEVAMQLNGAGEGLLHALRAAGSSKVEHDGQRETARRALIDYADLVVATSDVTLDSEDFAFVTALVDGLDEDFKTLPRRREAFKAVTDHVGGRYDIVVDAIHAAQLRGVVSIEHGLDLGEAVSSAPNFDVSEVTAPVDGRYLDTEIVAIYW